MFFEREDEPGHGDGKPTWLGVAAIGVLTFSVASPVLAALRPVSEYFLEDRQ